MIKGNNLSFKIKVFTAFLFILSAVTYADTTVDKLVIQLGASKYKERKKAEEALWKLLPDSEEALRKAALSDDPEINTRAKRVLEKYEKGILPGISEDVKRKIDAYWNSQKKSTYIRDWIYSSEFKDLPTIVTLMKLSARKGSPVYIQELMTHRNFFSTLYMHYGETDFYEFFIRTYAEQGKQEMYLNWVKTHSTPKKELGYYESHPKKNDDNIKSLRHGLYTLAGNKLKSEELLKGDLKKELAHLIQNKKYKEILQNEKLIESTHPIGEEKFKILFKRLSGDKESYKLAKQFMIDEYGTKVQKTFHLNVIHAMLANGEMDEAQKIAKKLTPLWYTRILSLQSNITEVEKFGNESKDSHSAAFAAYEYSKLFKKEECIKWLNRSKITELDDRWLYYYTKAYVFAYGLDNAFDHVIDKLENIASNSRYQLYYALCPSFTSVASYLVGYKNEDLEKSFLLLKGFILKTLKGEDLKDFYTKVSFNNGKISEAKIRIVYDAALYLGDEEKLKSHKPDYLKYDNNKLREAKRLLLNEEYESALEVLQSLKVKDNELKYYLYIKTRSYQKLGKQKQYEEALLKLKNSPSSSLEVNYSFLDFLDDFGEKKLIKYFLDQFQYSSVINNSKILERLIKHNLEEGDVDEAQFYSIRYYLNRSKNSIYLYPSFAIKLYLNFLSVDFKRDLKNKKVKEAVKHAENFLAISPHFYEFHVHVVNSLRKNGYQKESTEYFKKYMKHYEDLLQESPLNSTALNDWAWSAALCDRELDEAEKKARQAVKLDSKNANLWDTLGEVLYRKGKVKEAVDAQSKACLLVDPNRYSSFRAKLSKFKGTLE